LLERAGHSELLRQARDASSFSGKGAAIEAKGFLVFKKMGF
jgi:hypothetical protein